MVLDLKSVVSVLNSLVIVLVSKSVVSVLVLNSLVIVLVSKSVVSVLAVFQILHPVDCYSAYSTDLMPELNV